MNTTLEDFRAYDAQMAAMAALEAEALPHNKATLFGALAAAGIAMVVVCFDGSGDSGQIESLDAFNADGASIELPDVKIDIRKATLGKSVLSVALRLVREVIETMTYDLLRETHDGWEDNDGAYGEFTFSIAERSISLDYNERFLESSNYQHEF